MTTVNFDLVTSDKSSKALEKIAESGEKVNKQLQKLDKTTATAKVDLETDQAFGKLKSFGAKFTAGAAAVGVAAGAALTKSFTDAMDTQSALKKLDAQLGTTEFDSKKHGRIAGQLYADAYGESMSDVTTAIKSVVQNLDFMRDEGEKQLKVIAAQAMDAAEVLEEEVGPVTRAVAQMLRTGLAESAEEAFDVLVFGAQHGVNVAEDLLDTFSEYSTQFRSLGLDARSALGIMRQGLRGGARDADIVADAMKELNIRVSDKSAAAGLKDLGLNADRMAKAFAEGGPKAFAALDTIMDKLRAVKDPTDRYRIAQQLLGTQSEDLADALMMIDPSAATQGMEDLAGSTKRSGETLADTANNKITHWWRTAKQKIVDFISAEAIPKLEELVAKLDFSVIGTRIDEIASRLKGLWDEIFADVQEFVNNNRAEIESFTKDTEKAMENFGAVLSEVIGAVKALWELRGNEVVQVAFRTMNNVMNIVSGFMQQIRGIFQIVTGLLTLDWNTFWQGIRNIGEGMTAVLGNVLDGAMRLIVTAWGGDWEQMKRTAKEKLDGIVLDVKHGVNAIIGAWNWVATKLGITPIPLFDTRTTGAGSGGAGTQRLMATGGVVPGTGNRDSVPAMLTPGEVVFSKLAIKNLGGLRIVDAVHAAARQGRSGFERLFGGDPSEPGLAYFADGGAVSRTQAFGRAQAGKPYIWGGVGPRGFDCSGLASALTQVALGRTNPFHRLFATGSFSPGNGAGYFQPGLNSAFSVGVVRGNPGHMSTTVGGLNIEATPPVVRVGPGARGADHPSFNMRFSLPQAGGNFIGGGVDFGALIRRAFGNITTAVNAAGPFGGVASELLRNLTTAVTARLMREIPGFAYGGVVPGPYGTPRLATVHGGEAVLGLGWERRLANAIVPARSGAAERHYHLTVITNRSESDVRTQYRRMELMDGVG